MGVGHAYKGQILIGIIAAVLLAGGAYFLHPFTFESSYADSEDVSSTTTVNLVSNLSISATDVSISDIPDADGSWLTSTSNVVVSTNNETGYKLYMSSSSDQVDLVNSDNNKYKIENLSSETTETTFKSDSNLMNHYGFTHDNNGDNTDLGQITSGTYLPVTSIDNSRLIKATEEKQNISQTNVTFATKVDRSIPAGEYTNTITFTAIANPVPTPIVPGGYMHETTSQMCADSVEFDPADPLNTEYEVIDARTNEKYWVRKFGNLCWMVENLYLPVGTTISTTNNYSKVNFDKYPTTSSTSGWSSIAGAKVNDGVRYRTTDSGKYDGSYFNWYTATAGTGGNYGSSQAATSDICPTNWRLPTNAENGNMNSTISSAGGITSFYVNSKGASVSAILPGLYYTSSRSNDGSYAYWWSSTQDGANNAYYLRSGSSSLGTLYNNKSYGYSVRCVLSAS